MSSPINNSPNHWNARNADNTEDAILILTTSVKKKIPTSRTNTKIGRELSPKRDFVARSEGNDEITDLLSLTDDEDDRNYEEDLMNESIE